MIGRQWLGDVGLAVLLVLPTAALMWPAPSGTVQTPLREYHSGAGVALGHSQIEQRFGIKR